MDDGSRALPQKVDAATQQGPILRGGGRFSDTGFSDQELAEMGQSFTNNWEQTPHTVLPNMKLTLSGGKRFKTNGVNWGLLTGWTYRVQDSVLERTTRTYETGVTDLQLRSSADVVQSRQRVSLAGLISLGAESTNATLYKPLPSSRVFPIRKPISSMLFLILRIRLIRIFTPDNLVG